MILASGLKDFVEGGFYRYTVDNAWKLPPFETMLYDQAQLISLYSKAYKVFKKEEYKNVVSSTISFLKSEMYSDIGLFYAAMDADTDGEEGKYYSFDYNELIQISNETDFNLFQSYFNLDPSNPWENDKYLLLPIENKNLSDWLIDNNINEEDLIKNKKQWIDNILKIKGERTKPRIDDKIIVSWNALTISSFIDAYEALKNDQYLDDAIAMHSILQDKSFRKGDLIHTFKENQFQEGVLEDYAYFSKSSMSLFQATGDEIYFEFSKELTDKALDIFRDVNSDLLVYSNNEELFTKLISIDDGVIPSPNSILSENLFNIGHIIFDDFYLDRSNKMISSVKELINENINAYSVWGNNILNKVEPFFEVAVIGPNSKKITDNISSYFTPNSLVVQSSKESEIPLFIDRFFEDETYIYVCQNKVCQRPETKIDLALSQVPYIK